ncbi:hypothetical protein Tco_0862596 [Tanacetum coccineum]
MDPNLSLGKICLGEDVVVISSDKVEGSRDWNSPEFQDTSNNGQKKSMVFYRMDSEEVSDKFVATCFVNRLEAYDGEINLGVEENMISNEYAVKLCLKHEVKKGNKIVKKELIGALRGEIYFVKFIINTEEDDVERETEEEEKSKDDWDHLLDFNIDDVPLLGEEGLPPFICKWECGGRDDMKKVDRGITMTNHNEAEAIGILTNVLCQVGVTTLMAKFLILDIPIDRDSPIVVGRGFLRRIGTIVNTPERLFSTFDGFCHQPSVLQDLIL